MKNKNMTVGLAICLGLSTTAGLVGLSGCAGDRYNRSTGEYIDDKSVTSRVKSALGDNPDYKFENVNVTAFRGTVQLSGFVNMSQQKSKAGEIVKGVVGVKEVINNITVQDKNDRTAGESLDDKTVATRVRDALGGNP